MKEVRFIAENRERWKKSEAALRSDGLVQPDLLTEMYVQLSDDLSYAKTYYEGSEVITYLESMTVIAHRRTYQNRRTERDRFLKFFTHELPLAYRQSQPKMLMALTVFLLAIGLGVISSIIDADYVRVIMGDAYVNMTENNIAEGDPLAVYGDSDSGSMAMMIAVNNIRVSFLAFVAGILGSFGTISILFINGVMVGAFFYYFIEKGIGLMAISSIMIHGALELSAIVLAGAAGLCIGNALLFPGTYSRAISLRRGASRAVKIIIGLVPVFIVAAILESYVTRHYQSLGVAGSMTIAILSMVYVIWYFIIYPRRLYPDVKA